MKEVDAELTSPLGQKADVRPISIDIDASGQLREWTDELMNMTMYPKLAKSAHKR